MVSMEYGKKIDNLINNIKNEKLKEKLDNISAYISEFTDKKTEDFYDSLKKSKKSRIYELESLLLHRHFFFKGIKELNKELIENNTGFLVDITTALHNFFEQQILIYWEFWGYYDAEKNIMYPELLYRNSKYLKSLIKNHTDDDEILEDFEKPKTNLPIIYVNA